MGAQVLPMDRPGVLRDHTVVVANGRVLALGPAERTPVPPGARVVDARGLWLVPGLAEMHAHVPEPDPRLPPTYAEDVLALYALHGVTMVRAMAGSAEQLSLRARVERGEILGPRLWTVSPALSGLTVPDPAAAARRVREAREAGFDGLKIQEGLTPEAYAAIVAAAREEGLPFAGHVPDAVGIAGVLAAGQRSVEHLDGYLEATGRDSTALAELARATRAAGTWNTPTLDVWRTLLGARSLGALRARPELRYVPALVQEGWTAEVRRRTDAPWWRRLLRRAAGRTPEARAAQRDRALRALHAAGAPLLFGTDSPQLFNVPGFAVAHEAQALHRAGLDGWTILAMATRGPAEYLGRRGELGVVAPGAMADLLLLEGDPTADPAQLGRIAGVVVRGAWIDRDERARRLEAIARRMAVSPEAGPGR